ncbi:MAG TPA: HDOD domain-containing protein [Rhodocyclaceae bacterium]|nr:HDOD domain-containing protein [Rhodocyclaceae bacterium]
MQESDEARVQQLLGRLEIPPCPAILASLTEEMGRPNASANRIIELISLDVALAAGVIKCANSPLFGGSRVGSIKQALQFLGFKNVLNLVVSEVLRKSLSSTRQQAIMPRFWDNATYSAGVCAWLAATFPGTQHDTAYTFGLFRDCGIPILMRRFADYRDTLKAANALGEGLFTRVEDERHGTSHAVVGHLLLRNWGMPATVRDAILFHHEYGICVEDRLDKEASTLIGIGLVAERTVNLFLRVREDGEWAKGKGPVAEFFGISQAELEDVANDLLDRLESRRKAA